MKDNVDNNRILYDIDEGIIKKPSNVGRLQLPTSNNSVRVDRDRVQFPMRANSSNNNIPQTNNNVNSDTLSTNSNMQPLKNKRIKLIILRISL